MNEMEWVIPDTGTVSKLYWIIVYPRGDHYKLAVVEMYDDISYEEKDYSLASRKRFRDKQQANTYCRKLAKQHGLITEIDGDDFLD